MRGAFCFARRDPDPVRRGVYVPLEEGKWNVVWYEVPSGFPLPVIEGIYGAESLLSIGEAKVFQYFLTRCSAKRKKHRLYDRSGNDKKPL